MARSTNLAPNRRIQKQPPEVREFLDMLAVLLVDEVESNLKKPKGSDDEAPPTDEVEVRAHA